MKYNDLSEKIINDMKIEAVKNYPTYKLSSLELGGVAKIAAFPKNLREFCEILTFLKDEEVKFTVVGNCTNTFFADAGYEGILVSTKYLNTVDVKDSLIIADCGALISDCSLIAMQNSLSGLEFACGIPGSVGGAIYMNSSAFEGNISDVVLRSAVFDRSAGCVRVLDTDEHLFQSKRSILSENDNLVLLNTEFQLVKSSMEEIKSRIKRTILKRIGSQPLEFGSCGSTFKRPSGFFASELIDKSGLKGKTIGGAMISDKHAGFIVNANNATASDILSLIDTIKCIVCDKFGVLLEEEIIFLE